MKRIFTISTAALLLFALVTPQASASDEDWATAGKILAGVVGLGVLHNAFSDGHNHYRSYRSTTYYSSNRSYPSCRSSSYSYRPSYSYRYRPTTYYRTEVMRPVRAPVYHTTTVVREPAPVIAPAPPLSQEPVVVSLENGRRLYQPRIKGHVAYLQIYSEHSRSWVNLKEYPSLY
jgi:hypothetical protein